MIALPINVDELLSGQIVEWERLEFKKGWNPEPIMHSICAFANDINNWGGGYIIIGVEEHQGHPLFPPVGLSSKQCDSIQKELIEIGHRIRPNYHPIVQPVQFQGKQVLLLWCPGSATRPYEAPETLGKSPRYFHYIRQNSSTVQAREKDKQRLYELANHVPFDDRVCHQATLDNLSISLIRDFLHSVKSNLVDEMDRIPLAHLCRQMQIARGPKEYLKPVNIGLMMFNDHPEDFFPYAYIEIVNFHDAVGDSFSEKKFKGPLHVQLREALRYLRAMFLREEIRKRPDRAEADRFFNYPYVAVEEAVANAVYHKDYSQREPIEISIHPDRIEILSFPGPMPPLKIEEINNGTVRVRTYRNRRIGDFLKELHLTEGRCTGVLKIRKAMHDNGSPPAIFKTDDDNSYFLTVLPIHPEGFAKVQQTSLQKARKTHRVIPPKTHRVKGKTHRVTPSKTHRLAQTGPRQSGVLCQKNLPLTLQVALEHLGKRPSAKQLQDVILSLCEWQPLTAQQLSDLLGRKDKKHLVRQHLTPMIKTNLLEHLYPDSPDSPDQAYVAKNSKKR